MNIKPECVTKIYDGGEAVLDRYTVFTDQCEGGEYFEALAVSYDGVAFSQLDRWASTAVQKWSGQPCLTYYNDISFQDLQARRCTMKQTICRCGQLFTSSTWTYCPKCGEKIPDPPEVFRVEGVVVCDSVKRAVKTNEFRCPKKGEYFLSGAIPMAYLAPNDLSTKYRIMKLLEV